MEETNYNDFRRKIAKKCYNNYCNLYMQQKSLSELQGNVYPSSNINTFINSLSTCNNSDFCDDNYNNHVDGLGFLYNITLPSERHMVDGLLQEIQLVTDEPTVYDIYKTLLQDNIMVCQRQEGGKKRKSRKISLDPYTLIKSLGNHKHGSNQGLVTKNDIPLNSYIGIDNNKFSSIDSESLKQAREAANTAATKIQAAHRRRVQRKAKAEEDRKKAEEERLAARLKAEQEARDAEEAARRKRVAEEEADWEAKKAKKNQERKKREDEEKERKRKREDEEKERKRKAEEDRKAQENAHREAKKARKAQEKAEREAKKAQEKADREAEAERKEEEEAASRQRVAEEAARDAEEAARRKRVEEDSAKYQRGLDAIRNRRKALESELSDAERKRKEEEEERERQAEADRMKAEQEARDAEARRRAEADRKKAARRKQVDDTMLERAAAAKESVRAAKESVRIKAEQEARDAEEAARRQRAAEAEESKRKEEEEARKRKEEEEARKREQRDADYKQRKANYKERQAKIKKDKEERDARRAEAEEAARLKAEQEARDAEAERKREEEKAAAEEAARLKTEQDARDAEEAARRQRAAEEEAARRQRVAEEEAARLKAEQDARDAEEAARAGAKIPEEEKRLITVESVTTSDYITPRHLRIGKYPRKLSVTIIIGTRGQLQHLDTDKAYDIALSYVLNDQRILLARGITLTKHPSTKYSTKYSLKGIEGGEGRRFDLPVNGIKLSFEFDITPTRWSDGTPITNFQLKEVDYWFMDDTWYQDHNEPHVWKKNRDQFPTGEEKNSVTISKNRPYHGEEYLENITKLQNTRNSQSVSGSKSPNGYIHAHIIPEPHDGSLKVLNDEYTLIENKRIGKRGALSEYLSNRDTGRNEKLDSIYGGVNRKYLSDEGPSSELGATR